MMRQSGQWTILLYGFELSHCCTFWAFKTLRIELVQCSKQRLESVGRCGEDSGTQSVRALCCDHLAVWQVQQLSARSERPHDFVDVPRFSLQRPQQQSYHRTQLVEDTSELLICRTFTNTCSNLVLYPTRLTLRCSMMLISAVVMHVVLG